MRNKLLVISAAPLIEKPYGFSAYSPYIKELELWEKHSDEIYFCCPIWKEDRELLNAKIDFEITEIYKLEEFSILTIKTALFSLKSVVVNFYSILKAIRKADHIHLRCPGNIGLIGCVAQIFFPSKPKSAKYAGNWDPQSKQPLSYKIQKWILSNTFLTRNMQVLVYGDWPNQSKNIKAFFTASYSEADKHSVDSKALEGEIKFLFVGSLSHGKRPLYAVQIVEELQKLGKNVILDLYGEGAERKKIETYIKENQLQKIILHGNQNEEIIRNAYKSSHFLVLASKSEGWPKVVAEGMFWKSVPISTAVSCVAHMLDKGSRGILLQMNLKEDVNQILQLCENDKKYQEMADSAMDWSRNFTLDLFEAEIKKILQ